MEAQDPERASTTTTMSSTTPAPTLSDDELRRIDAWWRAANYLSVGQIYLMANPLLREPLRPEHVKPRLLGHWGTTPGLNFVYAHLNRAIAARDLDMIYVIGPGHGGPGLVASAYLEGTYSETYSDITLDEDGMERLFKQFSFPGGIPSHVAPETPGLDPRGRRAGLLALPRVRRGVRQPRPRRRSDRRRRRGGDRAAGDQLAQHQVRRPRPRRRRAADPAPQRLQDRQPDGAGPDPRGGARPPPARLRPHAVLRLRRRPRDHAPGRSPPPSTAASTRSATSSERARSGGLDRAPVLADDRAAQPQGLDRPEGGRRRSGSRATGTPTRCRSPTPAATTSHRAILEEWLRSYRPEELFDATGAPVAEIRDLHPPGRARMSANPHANGGLLLQDLRLPDFREYAVPVAQPGTGAVESTRVLGTFLRDVMARNADRFRVFSPDENNSNRSRTSSRSPTAPGTPRPTTTTTTSPVTAG